MLYFTSENILAGNRCDSERRKRAWNAHKFVVAIWFSESAYLTCLNNFIVTDESLRFFSRAFEKKATFFFLFSINSTVVSKYRCYVYMWYQQSKKNLDNIIIVKRKITFAVT